MEQYEGKIKITVHDPVMITDSTISYVTYLIEGVDQKGPFTIRRRYRDFHLLREKLQQRWPGLYIPPIPSKKVTGNTHERFVLSRKKSLNSFCQKISEREYIFSSQAFQAFIRNETSFETISKALPGLIEYQGISTVYQKNLTELTQSITASELLISTEADYLFIKSAEKKLEQLRDNFKLVVQTKAQYDTHYHSAIGKTMGDYEQKFLLHYVQGDRSKLFFKANQQFQDQLNQYRQFTKNNLMEDYVELISQQIREMRSFREAIESRKKAQDFRSKIEIKKKEGTQELEKLKSGKTTLKSIFTTGSKEDQTKILENSIEKWQQQEQMMANLIFLMNAAIYTQIHHYKARRQQQYRVEIQNMNKKLIKQMAVYGDMLAVVLMDNAEQQQYDLGQKKQVEEKEKEVEEEEVQVEAEQN